MNSTFWSRSSSKQKIIETPCIHILVWSPTIPYQSQGGIIKLPTIKPGISGWIIMGKSMGNQAELKSEMMIPDAFTLNAAVGACASSLGSQVCQVIREVLYVIFCHWHSNRTMVVGKLCCFKGRFRFGCELFVCYKVRSSPWNWVLRSTRIIANMCKTCYCWLRC